MAGAGWRDFVPGEVLTAANVQDYLQDQSVMVFASGAARTSALASPTEGMVSYLSDTNIMQMYTGSSWVTIADDDGLPVANGGTGATTVAAAQDSLGIGLVPISPTTVEKAGAGSTATANTLGKVTFASCTSLSLNGVFSSAFNHYRIVMRVETGTNTNVSFRMRAAGTDNTESVYDRAVLLIATGGTSLIIGGTNTTGFLMDTSSVSGMAAIDMFNPFIVTYTDTAHVGSGRTYTSAVGGNVHKKSVSYDGITFVPGGGSMFGEVQVFGYNG